MDEMLAAKKEVLKELIKHMRKRMVADGEMPDESQAGETEASEESELSMEESEEESTEESEEETKPKPVTITLAAIRKGMKAKAPPQKMGELMPAKPKKKG